MFLQCVRCFYFIIIKHLFNTDSWYENGRTFHDRFTTLNEWSFTLKHNAYDNIYSGNLNICIMFNNIVYNWRISLMAARYYLIKWLDPKILPPHNCLILRRVNTSVRMLSVHIISSRELGIKCRTLDSHSIWMEKM